ncbi:hypothetical protein LB565_21550 [Mesorhizobium sp. CA14]|uniref:hypothetical protein n=1 Tax=Mesorhizobium sp. CA14 TaxID=2876642 RepID=UPI001CCA0B72|nr:hypothetical protein [Mesorhizobium sp. CA14]MBZ9850572.1 hypothetical protein [Mesorhizobium sp. CA14]
MSTVLKTIYRDDGLARANIVRFEVGDASYFTFHEDAWYEGEHGLDEKYAYWALSGNGFGGGFYETAEAAESECRATIPWLRNSN